MKKYINKIQVLFFAIQTIFLILGVFLIYKKHMDLEFGSFVKAIFILAYIKSFFPRKWRKVNTQLQSRTGFTDMALKNTGFQYNFQYYFQYYLMLLILLHITIISVNIS